MPSQIMLMQRVLFAHVPDNRGVRIVLQRHYSTRCTRYRTVASNSTFSFDVQTYIGQLKRLLQMVPRARYWTTLRSAKIDQNQ